MNLGFDFGLVLDLQILGSGRRWFVSAGEKAINVNDVFQKAPFGLVSVV
jgi:hypothetical protein